MRNTFNKKKNQILSSQLEKKKKKKKRLSEKRRKTGHHISYVLQGGKETQQGKTGQIRNVKLVTQKKII